MSEDHIWKVAQSVGFDDYELRPMLEAFAAALSKPAPSPQPAAPVVSDERLLLEWDRVSHITEAGSRRLAFARAVLTLRPAVEPMTDDDVDAKCLTIIGHLLSRRERDRIVWRMAEAYHGVTAKADGGV